MLESFKWLEDLLDYNLRDGKLNRGSAVISSFKNLVPTATEQQILEAHAMAWCVEITQASFLIADDIMDASTTRRGKPCWYKKPEVGVMAINDSIGLLNSVYFLLDKYFKNHKAYPAVLSLMNEMIRKTVLGQTMDTLSLPPGQSTVNFDKYTIERHAAIVKYKTAFYTFSHPVRFALYLAGIADNKIHMGVEKILLKMGHFFQVQDDFLDCFGDPAVTGKIGSDIEDGKCAWPVVVALAKANPAERQLLQDNYGQKNPDSVAIVKSLYLAMDIEGIYRQFEEAEYNGILQSIADFRKEQSVIPDAIFLDYLDKIFKRKK